MVVYRKKYMKTIVVSIFEKTNKYYETPKKLVQ